MADTDFEEEVPKKPLISYVIMGVIVIGLMVGSYYAFNFISGLITGDTDESLIGDGEYLQIDEMLISIKSNSARQQYLKLKFSFELKEPSDRIVVLSNLPRILDDYQAFLRELKVEEIQGSGGWYRLKEEMLIRANTILSPTSIKEVLVSELVIQ